MTRVGVILLPEIFGTHVALRLKARALRRRGYPTEIVDIFAGQGFSRPFYLKMRIGGNLAEKMQALRLRLSDRIVFASIRIAVLAIKKRGCGSIILLGYGMGAIYALQYMELYAEIAVLHSQSGISPGSRARVMARSP